MRELDATSLAGGLALTAVGTLLVLDAAGEVRLGFGWLAPLLVAAIGFVLVVSGAAARPRGPERVRAAATSGPSANRHRPTTMEALRPEYRLGAGTLHVDLSALPLPAGVTRVVVRAAIGEATVLVPRDAHVVLTGRATVGRIDAFGERDEGIGVTTRREDPADGPRLQLDVSTAVGQVSVARATA